MIEYSVVWSNEDGGTGASAGLLMAQWGRTTDIEWIYRVEVDAKGRRVPGSGVFQSPNHGTTTFRGRYDGTHPLAPDLHLQQQRVRREGAEGAAPE